MAEESKSQAPPPPEGDAKPTAEKIVPPVKPASASPETAPVAASTAETPVPEKPAATPAATPPKPAAPAAAKPAAPATPGAGTPGAAPPAKPAAPAKPAGPVPMPWDSPMVEKYRGQYGSGIEAQSYLGQNYFKVDRSLIPDILPPAARRGALRLLRGHHRGALSQARKAIRHRLRSVLVPAQRAHARQDADRGRRDAAHRVPHLADGQLAGARSLSTCSASSSTGIRT